MAQAFAAAGARVVLTSERPLDGLGDDAEPSSASPAPATSPADLTRDGEPERLVAEAWDALGGIDVLVNNVGTYREPPFLDLTQARLRLRLPAERVVGGRGDAGGRAPRGRGRRAAGASCSARR